LKVLFPIIFLLSTFCVGAQGFDWQKTTRVPYVITQNYIGLNAAFNADLHLGNFPFLENTIQCCEYESGVGNTLSIGVAGEYWYKPDFVFSPSVNISFLTSSFNTQNTIPRRIDPDLPPIQWTTEYESNINFFIINLDLIVRKRMITDFLSIEGGIGLNYLLSESSEHINRVVSPEELTFENGQSEILIEDAELPELNNLIPDIKLGVGYDFDLGIENYLHLSLLTTLNPVSFTSEYTWRRYSIGINAKYLFGVRQ